MEWGEAIRLISLLRRDPTSWVASELEGWDHPISREALILMDLFDLDHKVAAGKKTPKPHPGRPWKNRSVQRLGDVAGRTPDEVRAILASARAGGFGEGIPV